MNLTKGQRIGLLGGSFNPAHAGHVHISESAIKLLDLDRVWWLVSPQNPLKPERGMKPALDRLRAAREFVTNPLIEPTGIEMDEGLTYTSDTLAYLTEKFPEAQFVWLMGADNLLEFHRWRNWPDIFQAMPIAVLARPNYSLRALNSKAAKRFERYRMRSSAAKKLATTKPPAWIFLPIQLHDASSTEIRESEGA